MKPEERLREEEKVQEKQAVANGWNAERVQGKEDLRRGRNVGHSELDAWGKGVTGTGQSVTGCKVHGRNDMEEFRRNLLKGLAEAKKWLDEDLLRSHKREEQRQRKEAENVAEKALRRFVRRQRVKRMMQGVAMAAFVVAVGVSGTVGLTLVQTQPRLEEGSAAIGARKRKEPAPQTPPEENSAAEDGVSLDEPPEASPSPTLGLDGGSALAEAVRHALPLPPNGLPGQRAAPCHPLGEDIGGHCWFKHQLTTEQVEAGACDTYRLYEPSEGWCREHQAGYWPVFLPRRRTNPSAESR